MNIKYLFILLFAMAACASNNKETYTSPSNYDFTKPEKFIMPAVLHEISGIAFNKGNSDSIYAEQDEEGKVFHLKLGDKNFSATKFAKKGDYEDMAICNGTVVVLRSDGALYSFPLAGTNNKEASNVQEWTGLLPTGEYEGMYADETSNLLYVLCKHCNNDKKHVQTSGHILNMAGNGPGYQEGFVIDVKQIEKRLGDNKTSFRPSAMARNTITNEWYILSSVNKLLVTADKDFTVREVYPLNPSIFNQPEGMAFDRYGNLFISNEGGDMDEGNILKFKRK